MVTAERPDAPISIDEVAAALPARVAVLSHPFASGRDDLRRAAGAVEATCDNLTRTSSSTTEALMQLCQIFQ